MSLGLADAAKAIGISTDLLRHFCDEGALPGQRGPRGHWTFEVQDLPTREQVVDMATRSYERSLAKMDLAIARVRAEVEAVQLDVQEQVDVAPDLTPLGNDVRAMTRSGDALTETIRDMRWAAMEFERAHRMLRGLHGFD